MNKEGTTKLTFPPDFVWGAATSSYQIEGSHTVEGRGESIWDHFCRLPGAISDGTTGDTASDHYRLWKEDVRLMSELGLGAYRFSIAWPRVFPEGKGLLNRAGLDFYERLVDALLAEGITPYVTLYHWDLPQALQRWGGWANRDTAGRFADYADAVAARLGDRVRHWITHNEPWVVAFLGHLWGEHAPGKRDVTTAYAAAHHLLLSHGLATEVLRARSPGSQVGITLNLEPKYPASEKRSDAEATLLADGLQNRWFLDPIFHGRYPDDVLEKVQPYIPPIEEADMKRIQQPIDFLGINYYSRQVVRYDPGSDYFDISATKPTGAAYTEMNWEVYPDGLRELLVRVHKEYPLPAYYITENGAAFLDELLPDGTVHDNHRLAYFESHIAACSEAIAAGVPLKGYFAWSLMDNFEWAHGYTKRFGIVYVDYATQKRYLKDSARWYREMMPE